MVYIISVKLYQRLRQNPLVLPVFTSVCVIVSLLLITKTDYETYFSGVQLLHFFLVGPATVGLAIPLYHQLPKLVDLCVP
ncbi:LrgB family protein [Paenalcaligenes hominis]|uniref:LrgB family protein n=1 Tax=Paenalcaligenes hominis TaxID=643674 RepID=UPI00362253A6